MASLMSVPASSPLRGRQAEAAAHDAAIMHAAFVTMTTNPRATMADIAKRAGVGVASLYRRYPTRQALAHDLCLRTMRSISAAAECCSARLQDTDADPWKEFVLFLENAIADGAGAMRALAGTFDADHELAREAAQMNRAIQRLVRQAQRLGAVRRDVTGADITQFFDMLRAIRIGNPRRSDQLRQRYLHLFAIALQATPVRGGLPTAPPRWQEVSGSWNSTLQATDEDA